MGTDIGVLSVASCFIDGGVSVKSEHVIWFLVTTEVALWLLTMTLSGALADDIPSVLACHCEHTM